MTPREEPGTTVQKAEELAAAGPKTGRKKTLSQKLLRSMSSRQQPETRKVRVGGYDPTHSKDNVVTTSKFSWWNFLPLALMAEFRRMANLYFLLSLIHI